MINQARVKFNFEIKFSPKSELGSIEAKADVFLVKYIYYVNGVNFGLIYIEKSSPAVQMTHQTIILIPTLFKFS